LIVERTGNFVKRHRGVQRELGRLTKDEPGFEIELRAFLGRTYNLKALADYETGPGSRVPAESARHARATAERFSCRRSRWSKGTRGGQLAADLIPYHRCAAARHPRAEGMRCALKNGSRAKPHNSARLPFTRSGGQGR
jgi:hypothetical protein